ncbi:MAG: four helix bundle protein [Kiritimatiellia bacterium]
MGYKDLIVWQKGMELVEEVYRLIKAFPADERFRLGAQLSRAVVSVPSNIAEGYGRGSSSDYAHFLSIARSSLYEVETQLEIALRLGYLSVIESAQSLINEIRAMLVSMITKLKGAAK